MEHSPLPWVDNGNEIVSESNLQKGIAGAMTEDDICFILEACNNYERVMEENKELKLYLIRLKNSFIYAKEKSNAFSDSKLHKTFNEVIKELNDLINN
ncbi:MAG: hypothetical protein ACFFDF_00270 [Candidatus Odinarchaeota archaeon]